MSVDQSQLDLNTLQWVKSEIDATLKQARTALEAHVEYPDDSTQLKLIGNFLHQVRGTLQMVELYGAAMLAEELEHLTNDIITAKIEGRDDIYEVMMQAMWQLPDYLERLQSGYKDIPMVLLPLLNDLRAARGQPLLSESALFTPDLDVDVPVSSVVNEESLSVLAKRLRHTFHLGLLDWYRERDSKGGLKKLDSVIEKLRESANDAEVNRVLWPASGVLEALKQGGIEASVAVKLLMGQVDRQIKRIIDHGESALAAEPPAELEKNLLYYVASASSTGERVNALKEKFKLAEALPDAETLEQARIDLTGPNAELMQTVSTVLLDNLLQVKDALDVLVRSEEKDLSSLPSLAAELSQVADTLGMLGFGKQRQSILEQGALLRAIASGEKSLDEAELMGVAHALLSVENILQGNVVMSVDTDSDQSTELTAETREHQLIDSVMTEARANMAKVKDSLSLYIDMPRNTSLIADVPSWLDQIRGSFEMLAMHRPAGLIAGCRDYIQTTMIDAKRSQNPAQMDALADAISSIEYFMDSVAGQWGNPGSILNVAEEKLALIGVGGNSAVELEDSHGVEADVTAVDTDTLTELVLDTDSLPQTDDTMIDLGSPDFEQARDDSVEMMDIDLSDMSTAELSLAEFERELAELDTSRTSDHSQELATDEPMISMGDISVDLSAGETEQAAETSRETQEIEFDSTMLDASLATDTATEPTEKSINDTQEIDFDSALLALDASIEDFENKFAADKAPIENTSNNTQEIKFDSAILEVADSSEFASLAEDNSGLADIQELTLEPIAEDSGPLQAAVPSIKSTPPVAVSDIELQLADWYQNPANKKLSRKLQKDLKTIKQFAKDTDQQDISKIAKDMIAVIKAVQNGESDLTDDIRNILQLANVTLAELFDNDPSPLTATPQFTEQPPEDTEQLSIVEELKPAKPDVKEFSLPEDIDDEIVEIFSEEAREEHANISRLLPLWRADTSDEESLREMRRSFHTLKGSGRLVGAADVGEFAWAFENMLNRVIDKSVEPSPAMFGLIQQAIEILPELLQMYISGGKPGQDIFAIMQQAEALSQGKDVVAGEVTESPEPHETSSETLILDMDELVHATEVVADTDSKGTAAAVTESATNDVASRVPVIDETLRDIYRKEVETHLAALHAYVEGWRDDVDRSANNKLIRTVHTLTGCSRTATVASLAEVFGEAEKYIKYLENSHIPLSESAVRMLVEAIDIVEQTIAVLDAPGTALPDVQDLLQKIHSLYAQAQASSGSPADDANVTRLQAVSSNKQQDSAAIQSDYDEELLGIFIEEGTEILDEADQTLHQWAEDKQNPEYITIMQRLLHTLKGGARLAGLAEMGDLSHSIESMLESIVDEQLEMSEQVHEILIAAQDALLVMLDEVRARQSLTSAVDIISRVDQLLGNVTPATPVETVEIAEQQVEPDVKLVQQVIEPDSPASQMPDNVVQLNSLGKIAKLETTTREDEQLPAERISPKELVRVRSELLDNLVNFAGEVSIYRSRMEQQTNAFRYNLQELDDTVNRLREQLRKFEMEAEAQIQYRSEESFSQTQEDFDPLEFDRFTQMQQLSRGMMESLNDLDSLRAILAGLTRESETLLVQQSRVNTELQEGLMRTRMVPFNSQANRLRRIVRQTAEELGKKAELHLHGADSEIDRTVLERMLPALEHMLRNAVAHGVEMPSQRNQANKPEIGQINLGLSREGADIVLTLTDDGAGIDLVAIQQKAIEKGKLKADAHVTRETLFDLIMESGFSTADEVTQIAGRGVGMDVVNNEIKQLGGLLNIDTEQSKGTRFTISLPLTLSLTRALMVQVGEETFALPLLSVEGVERISTEQLQALYDQENPVYSWLGQDYPFMHLGSAMGISKPHIPADRSRIPLLLVRSGEYRAAVQLDNLIGSREIVVKPVGPQLSTMRGIAGATIMGDGGVVLIIDLGVLIRAAAIQQEIAAEPISLPTITEPETHEPVIMVIDDSITVRKVTTRLLERNNYRAVSAKDGVDALAQLQETHPDIMLLDVEMPRMDGFELATNVRNDERLKDIPIIMITSRTGQKHRDRADKIGVNIYMGKPFSEGELLDNIQSLLEQRH